MKRLLGAGLPTPQSDFRLLGHLQGVGHFDAEVANRTLQYGVAKKQLHCAQVFRPTIDQGCLGSPDRMGSIFRRI